MTFFKTKSIETEKTDPIMDWTDPSNYNNINLPPINNNPIGFGGKRIPISVSVTKDEDVKTIFCVCNDGSIWFMRINNMNTPNNMNVTNWFRLPDIPK